MERYFGDKRDKQIFLSSIGLECIENAKNYADEKKFDKAVKAYALCWGANFLQGNKELMELCDRLIENVSFEANLEEMHKYGEYNIRKLVNLDEKLSRWKSDKDYAGDFIPYFEIN